MNSFGHLFAFTTYGESHGPGVGVVVDGCPPGIPISEDDIQVELDRRRPGQSSLTTPRKEADKVKIFSGIFQGRTTGAPIMMLIENKNVRSQDYGNIKDKYRPMHADYTMDARFGFRDYRGGGRTSARETVGRVAAGAIAMKALNEICGMKVIGHVKQVGTVRSEIFDPDVIEKNPVRAADLDAAKKMEDVIAAMKPAMDSVGGVVEVVVQNVPAGLGSPTYWKIKSEMAHALMGINAVQGVEYGSGFEGAAKRGSEHNDEFYFDSETQRVRTKSNNHGGILGGITSGENLILRAAFKPVSSLPREQDTVDRFNENTTIQTFGRHEKCVLPRAVPICEAMVACVLLDQWLISQAYGHHVAKVAADLSGKPVHDAAAGVGTTSDKGKGEAERITNDGIPGSVAPPAPARTAVPPASGSASGGVCPFHAILHPVVAVPGLVMFAAVGVAGYYLGRHYAK